MNILLTIANFLVISLGCILYFKREHHIIKKWYWVTLVLHITTGLLVGILYIYYYKQGDTLLYFQEGLKIKSLLNHSLSAYLNFLWFTDSTETFKQTLIYTDPQALFMVKCTSIVLMLTGKNYWLCSVYFSLFSFFASWTLTKTLINFFPKLHHAAIFSFLLYPSVVFWSSGIVKESIAIAALFFLVYLFLLLYKENRISWIQAFIILILCWLLYSIKYYYVAVLIPTLLSTWFIKKVFNTNVSKSFLKQITVWFITFIVISVGATFIHPNFNANRFLAVLYQNYQIFISFSAPEDVMYFPYLKESWLSVALHAPWAIVSGIFRPFIWESGNTLQVVAALENLFLLTISITALPKIAHLAKETDGILIVALLVFCGTMAVFLTLSTPNFGTLIRYRIGFLPFFVLIVSHQSIIFKKIEKFLLTINARLVAKKP